MFKGHSPERFVFATKNMCDESAAFTHTGAEGNGDFQTQRVLYLHDKRVHKWDGTTNNCDFYRVAISSSSGNTMINKFCRHLKLGA